LPYGLFGGKPGASATCTIYRQNRTVERIAPKMLKADRLLVRQGDIVVIEAPSGGGYGNPLERDAASVQRDVLDGVVSSESARRDYGVVLRDDCVIDVMATTELRTKMLKVYEARSRELGGINRNSYTLDPEAVR